GVVKAGDGVAEGFAGDDAHGVVGVAAGPGGEGVDGDDAGVVEPAGELGLAQEPVAGAGIAAGSALHAFEGDLAFEFGAFRSIDDAEPALAKYLLDPIASGERPIIIWPGQSGGGNERGLDQFERLEAGDEGAEFVLEIGAIKGLAECV